MDVNEEIGGYLGLDSGFSEELHSEAIHLDSGRNCFKYILKAKNISKVYLPLYISGSMVEPFSEIETKYEQYNVDESLEIDGDIEVGENEKIVIVNYFTMKTDYILKMVEKYKDKIIVDNTHALFHKPLTGIDTFYSPSKFIGVSDGGYLYTNTLLDEDIKQDVSWKRAVHIYGRIDEGAEAFYKNYRNSEDDLRYKPIRTMSNLTKHILVAADYKTIKLKRERNFYYLHSNLGNLNHLKLDFSRVSGPLIYPFLTNKKGLRDYLIKNKVLVATYWPRVLDIPEASETERYLTKNLVALPIDQRYDIKHMKTICDLVMKYSD